MKRSSAGCGPTGTSTFILATCVLVATVVWQRRNGPTPEAPEPFKVGEQAEALPGVGYADAKISVIVYLRSTCQYCTRSMPFYRRLSDKRHDSGPFA